MANPGKSCRIDQEVTRVERAVAPDVGFPQTFMPDPVERRLAAIMFTDIVGSTALMAKSEPVALRVKQRHRTLVRTQVDRYHGEFIEAPGDETLSRLDLFEAVGDIAFAVPFSQGAERYLRGRVLEKLGRPRAALPWYAALEDVGTSVYLAPSLFRRGKVYEALSESNRAAEHYARFIELWEDCDPELRPRLAQAEERLAALKGEAAGSATTE